MEIWFDMDGTIADLYGVRGWLSDIQHENARPYRQAKPLIDMQMLGAELNKKIDAGYSVGVVSWLAKNGSVEYNKKVVNAKKNWLKKYLPNVQFTTIDIIEYGTPKQLNRNGILFDDEKQNRDNWQGIAYDVQNIIEVLKELD